MKTYTSKFQTSLILFLITINVSISQINIQPGPDVTPEDMVEFLVGPGVIYDNVTYQGVDQARGIFTNGSSTNIGMDEGIFLTSGAGYIIPGPNSSSSAGANNGQPGHPWLNDLTTATTFDACVLSFDFIPLNDTVKCRYVFGSEEYNEWVGTTFNDVFGFFVTGPNPTGGNYSIKNIALIPDTTETPVTINNVNNGYSPPGIPPTGPCTNCEYYSDNTGGLTIEYDGFTTVLTAWVLVVPNETYNFTFGVADAGDHIYDSGVLLEGTSFKSPGPAEFFAFDFLQENNPGLPFDIIGEIEGSNVFLEAPEGTDVSNLVASWEEHGADVYIGNVRQESGLTPNDFTDQVIYHLVGYESADWNIFVDIVVDIPEYLFNKVKVGPNPALGEIVIENAQDLSVFVYNTLGRVIYETSNGENILSLTGLQPGIYFIKLEKDGRAEVRKIVVQ